MWITTTTLSRPLRPPSNKVPYPQLLFSLLPGSCTSQRRAVIQVARSLLPRICGRTVSARTTAVGSTQRMQTCYPYFENRLTSWPYSWARGGCFYCRRTKQSRANPLCRACDRTLSQSTPKLVQVPSDNKIFRDSKPHARERPSNGSHRFVQWPTSSPRSGLTLRNVQQFMQCTRLPETGRVGMHTIPIGRLALDKSQGSRNGVESRRDYSNRLERYSQFVDQGMKIGNERLLWHGTRRVCNLGDPGNTAPCANPSCALCSIVRGSFDVAKVTTNTSWTRFGAGIYTSTGSSK